MLSHVPLSLQQTLSDFSQQSLWILANTFWCVSLEEFQSHSDAGTTTSKQDLAIVECVTSSVQQIHSEHAESNHMQRETLFPKLSLENLPLPPEKQDDFWPVLADHHKAFSLLQDETDLVEMTINTGEVTPKRQPVRRVPFAVRKELAQQLLAMECNVNQAFVQSMG